MGYIFSTLGFNFWQKNELTLYQFRPQMSINGIDHVLVQIGLKGNNSRLVYPLSGYLSCTLLIGTSTVRQKQPQCIKKDCGIWYIGVETVWKFCQPLQLQRLFTKKEFWFGVYYESILSLYVASQPSGETHNVTHMNNHQRYMVKIPEEGGWFSYPIRELTFIRAFRLGAKRVFIVFL